VNLYSKSRGINRFPALIEALELLQNRPEVAARGIKIEIPASLRTWIQEETKLGNPALEAKVKSSNDPALVQALKWSKAVNDTIKGMVRAVPPFPYVRESLARLAEVADVFVVSATPNEALKAEWHEHGIDKHVVDIFGQEAGSKKEALANAKKYAAGQALMIGDAPGDFNAAKANNVFFYPINPGEEEASWERFYKEGIDRFLNGKFGGDYQAKLLAEFEKYLPEKPSWKTIR
jgi:phosphoglycolate phosphatase-like HAD superfamily hydrolase